MDQQSVENLFERIAEGVLGLRPEPSGSDSVIVFSSPDSSFSLPVFVGAAGIHLFCGIHRAGQRAQEVFRQRLFTLHNGEFVCVGKDGEERSFPQQGVFNSPQCSGFQRDVAQDLSGLIGPADVVSSEFLFEAYFVGYFLHEFRHLFQIQRFGRVTGVLKRDCPLPPLTNSIIPGAQLRTYWERWIHEQLASYTRHYQGEDEETRADLLSAEEDAMIIQLQAFDCWLTTGLSQEKRFARLREILQFRN